MSGSVGARVQELPLPEQALAVAQLAAARGGSSAFAPRDLDGMFVALGLPGPSSASNAIASLQRRGWVCPGNSGGTWRLTPLGPAKVAEILSDMDQAALAAEAEADHGPVLGRAVHTVVPPSLAPPALIARLQRFLEEYPFETNVFGMTRFPLGSPTGSDPVVDALVVAKDACEQRGLTLHLASDRSIDDDLWTNVAGHMWGCRYGLAIFEDRVGRGLNYNLTIEVGSMLMTGRRCALLKDSSIDRMPTDLVGRIYKEVELDDPKSVREAVSSWVTDDLGIR